MSDYGLILIPIAAVIISQLLKLATDGIKGNFDFKHALTAYGGMPSSHTAFVFSLLTIVGLIEGLISTAFAITLVFSILFVRDALGLRNEIGKQAKAINQLANVLPEERQKEISKLKETIGHTAAEVFVGGILGVAIAIIGWYLL